MLRCIAHTRMRTQTWYADLQSLYAADGVEGEVEAG